MHQHPKVGPNPRTFPVPGPYCQAYISRPVPHHSSSPITASSPPLSQVTNTLLLISAGTALPLQGTKLKRGRVQCPGGETDKRLQTGNCTATLPLTPGLSTQHPPLHQPTFPPHPLPLSMPSHTTSKEIRSWLPEWVDFNIRNKTSAHTSR